MTVPTRLANVLVVVVSLVASRGLPGQDPEERSTFGEDTLARAADILTGGRSQARPGGPELRIIGLRTLSPATASEWIGDQWGVIEDRGLSPSRASDAQFLLELALRERGYPNAEVSWRILPGNRILELTVDEGEQFFLGEIRIEGSADQEHLDRKLVEAALFKEIRDRQPWLKADARLPYVQSALESGVKLIEDYAAHAGYLETTAVLKDVRIDERRNRVDVVVAADFGRHFSIRDVRLEGAEAVHANYLRPELAEFRGKPLNMENARNVQGLIRAHYEDRGYFDVEVETVAGGAFPIPAEANPVMVVAVRSGERYKVTELKFSGYRDLKVAFLRKRFERFLGDDYDPEAVRETFRDLIGTGLFTNLEIAPEPLEPGKLRLDIAVEEAEHRELGVYGGFGNFDGYILGLTYADRNLFGTGRSLRSRVEINSRGVVGDATYLDRWFLDRDLQLSLQAFTGTKDLEGYDKWELGWRASLLRTISEHSSFSFFGELRHVSITRNSFVGVDIGPEDYQMESLGISYTWDHSKQLEDEGHAFRFEASFDYAGAFLFGDVEFLRGVVSYSHYVQLFADTELRLGARSGIMVPIGGSDSIPIDARFFNGGPQSVRSFPQRELGEKDARHHPLGGEFYTVFNTEYLIPVADALQFAVFADAGNLLRAYEDASLDDMHYAAGVGLRYQLPVGPLRIDYGWNMNRQKGEPSGTFHLTFGFAF